MLEIQNIDILDEKKLNVVKKKSKKTQILLYDTQIKLSEYIMKLRYRNNEKYENIPHFIVSKSGDVFKIFNDNHSSVTFGDENVDKKQIKIVIENLGWLKKNTITGVFFNWLDIPYRLEPFIKKWRGFFYWDKYTDNQLKSLSELCEILCEKHKIPFQIVPHQGFFKNASKFNGIICKSNFADIYIDINPSFDFKYFKVYGSDKT
jgi:N-acetyl-anhydromuramyl-L-alanine amidase AmpD